MWRWRERGGERQGERQIDGQILEDNKIKAKLDEQERAMEKRQRNSWSQGRSSPYTAPINCDTTPWKVVALTCPIPHCPLPIGGLCTWLGAREIQRH